MKIMISFKGHKYQDYIKNDSFDNVQKLENYHNIKYLNCANNNIKE